MSKIEYKGLTADVWYDDRDPSNKGWYAEYRDARGTTYSDSMKVWEGEEMPRRESAEKKAHALALRALKAEYRRRQAASSHATKLRDPGVWHLEPGDVTHAEESHMSKRSKPSSPKKSEAQLDGEIEEFLLNSPYAEKDKHTKVEFVYYIIPNGNKHAGGWLPVYDENGKQRGDTWAGRGMSKDDAWAESERIARDRGGRFTGDWQIKLRKGKERK